MPTAPAIEILLTAGELRALLADDARAGLAASPKAMRSRWVWDARASELFERILALPAYDLPERESALLAAHADAVARAAAPETAVELGSGSSRRTPLLLDALLPAGLRRYVAVDVSEAALRDALPALAGRYPGLEIAGAVADFERQLAAVDAPGRRLVAVLGSTLGALDRDERAAVLATVAAFVAPDGALLLGLDLVKPLERIVATYAHADGLGDELSRNLLPILNRELGADFRVDRFDVVRGWNAGEERLETAVRSLEDQVVTLPELPLAVSFAAGETLRTQVSTKFRREGVEAELGEAGLSLREWWTDADEGYALCLSTGST